MQPLSCVLCVGHFIERVCHPALSFDPSLTITRVHIGNRSRVTRLVRANSKYKYVICRSKGACVTEHLPRARGPRFSYPKEHRLKRRGPLRQRKSMTYRQLPCDGDVGPSSSLLMFLGTYDHPRWDPASKIEDLSLVIACASAVYVAATVRCKLQAVLISFIFEFSFLRTAEKIISLENVFYYQFFLMWLE